MLSDLEALARSSAPGFRLALSRWAASGIAVVIGGIGLDARIEDAAFYAVFEHVQFLLRHGEYAHTEEQLRGALLQRFPLDGLILAGSFFKLGVSEVRAYKRVSRDLALGNGASAYGTLLREQLLVDERTLGAALAGCLAAEISAFAFADAPMGGAISRTIGGIIDSLRGERALCLGYAWLIESDVITVGALFGY